MKDEIVVLSASTSQAINTTIPKEPPSVLYFVNLSSKVGGNTSADPLIKCTNGNCVSQASGVSGDISVKYYIDGSGSKKTIIECDSTSCKYTKIPTTGNSYYIVEMIVLIQVLLLVMLQTAVVPALPYMDIMLMLVKQMRWLNVVA